MKQTLFIRQLATYFETHLPDARRCSPNTITSYADAFALLFQFLQERKGIPHYRVDYKNFTPATMDDFMLWMRLQSVWKTIIWSDKINRNCCWKLPAIKDNYCSRQKYIPEKSHYI